MHHVDAGGEIVLPTTVVMLTEKTILGGGMVGVEELLIERNAEFVIDNNATTADNFDFQEGRIQTEVRGSSSGHFRIPIVQVNNLGLFTIDMNPRDPIIDIAEFTVRNGGLVAVNTTMVYIESTNLTVEYGGEITGSGQGSPAGEGTGAGGTTSYDSAGGGFAGSGGSSYHGSSGGTAYGKVDGTEYTVGSGGGGASGGAGGNFIKISVGQEFTLEGTVSVDGIDGLYAYNSGGGSGGLLLVNTSSLFGRGSMTSNGGAGLSGNINGELYGNGPGSGGRIALYLAEELTFQGTLAALGGSFSGVNGSEYRHSAPGTVYVKSTVGDDVTTDLRVDNFGRSYAYSYQCAYPINIDVDALTHLRLYGKACVKPTVNLVIDELGGDGTGTLSIPADIEVTIAEDELRTHLRSSIYNEGVVNLPTTTYVEQNITTDGNMIGVEHLYTRGYTRLRSSGNAECGSASSTAGQFYFHSFTVLDGGDFSFFDEESYDVTTGMLVYTDVFHMEGASTGEISRSCFLMGRETQIEQNAVLSGSNLGYFGNSGPGAGQSCSCGTGGGHGGAGGRCRYCGSCSGGATYDSYMTPSIAGSGGGKSNNGITGTGGAALRMVYQSIIIDGSIYMDGQASSGGSGGGAGGAIWIDAEYIYGRGRLQANGGAGSNHGVTYSGCSNGHHGGGGGGGMIRSFGKEHTSEVLLHYRYVSGGTSSYSAGSTGTLHQSHSNQCSGHGTWNSNTTSCDCGTGYVGYDCQYTCDDETTCNGNGICSSTGTCECFGAFVGHHCEHECHRNSTCSGNGECSTCGTCICDPCFHGPDCSMECSSNGQCEAGVCKCDDCHLGRFCESECNGHGTCDFKSSTCSCDANWRDSKCTLRGCPGADQDCSGHGICNAVTASCYCDPGFKGDDCSFVDCPGEPNCNDRGFCNDHYDPPRCTNCDAGWMGPACDDVCLHGTPDEENTKCVCEQTCWNSTGCDIECSGHGTCDGSGACNCTYLLGYTGTYCEVPGCPWHPETLEQCSGHGNCDSATHICECEAGWAGVACHIPWCPGEGNCFERGLCNGNYTTPRCEDCEVGWMGPDCNTACTNGVQEPMNSGNCSCNPGWAGVSCDSECSEHGTINQYDECECYYDDGWKGPLCDIPGCPGLNQMDCSGRGECDSSIPLCTCNAGWSGIGCETADCPGEPDCNADHCPSCTCDDLETTPVCRCTGQYFGEGCEKECLHGVMNPPGSTDCECDPGWTDETCSTECSFHGSIVFDAELGHDRCRSDVGWRGTLCDQPGCPGVGKDCTGHGECNKGTHTCDCYGGWTGDPDPLLNGCDIPDCPGVPDCNDRGICDDSFDTPVCLNCTGSMGAGCELNCTYGVQTPMNSSFCLCDSCHTGLECNIECNGQGTCNNSMCQCNDHWKGSKCEVPACPGTPDCMDHGTCNSAEHICICNPGWTGLDCSIPDCGGCGDNGFCNGTTDPPFCQCQPSYFYPDCSKLCENGTVEWPTSEGYCHCDPCYSGDRCQLECSGNGICNGTHCNCTSLEGDAWEGPLCSAKTCPGNDGPCNGHGVCNALASLCTCDPGWQGYDCGTPQCLKDCSGNGTCLEGGICECNNKTIGEACDITCVNGYSNNREMCVCSQTCITGYTCNAVCNNNGECAEDGSCICNFDALISGEQCDEPGCPGEPDCSEHGTCVEATGECVCDKGWKGIGCEIAESESE